MLHTAAELQNRASQCRQLASQTEDCEVHAEMLELATAFEEEAAKVEREGTFEDGYQDGWSSVAGADPLPEDPTQPLPSEERTPDKGYIYGVSDAKDADRRLPLLTRGHMKAALDYGGVDFGLASAMGRKRPKRVVSGH